MLEVRHPLNRVLEELSLDLEIFEEVTSWMFEEDLQKQQWIYGYFEDQESVNAEWALLRDRFPHWELPQFPEVRKIEDQEWQDSYRKFFSPHQFGKVHWIPEWQKEIYSLPEGDVGLYLDPGLAFGTGEHETTQLCMAALIHWHETRGKEKLEETQIVDAGCGSGILALSALLLGYRHVLAFDNDPQSIAVSEENRRDNQIRGGWDLRLGTLECALDEAHADCLMANIQADVLMRGASHLVRATKKEGILILSGILKVEAEKVKTHFLKEFENQSRTATVKESSKGEWSALCFTE